MAEEGKFVLRAGGFGVWFFSAVGLLFLWGLYMAVRQGPGASPMIAYILSIGILVGIPAYFIYLFAVPKIELGHDTLKARFVFGQSPLPVTWTLRLPEISEVILGPIGKLKERDDGLANLPNVRAFIDQYESLRANVQGMSISMRGAVQFSPLIVVKTKDPDKSQVIITKPFSRKGARALMAEFRLRGIKVSGDEKL